MEDSHNMQEQTGGKKIRLKRVLITVLIVIVSGGAGFLLGWHLKPSFEWKALDIHYEEGNLLLSFIPAPYINAEETTVRIVFTTVGGDVIREEPAQYYDGIYGCAFTSGDFGLAKIYAVLNTKGEETRIPLAENVTVLNGQLQEYKTLYRRSE